ncbi:short-chain dehydrogenase/reductase family 9C member 7-like [Neocloeon triangulifer]|uniref:short-chain dehydrogenase/reductase family 9C member 7-like n=1 Tax=Neocloeon triangulifer TaxID=2078957 RepID=UPI00286EE799|nr:short-chain dehydrogenase/reductase family 9C member 7-like [Neocloeon triangulifer]
MSDKAEEDVAGVLGNSFHLEMISKRLLLFFAWFAGTLGVLAYSPWLHPLLAWLAILVVASFVATWGVTLAASKLPKKYIKNLEYTGILITGCDSGFGLQLALRLHLMGVAVYAGVLNENSEGARQLKAKNCAQLKVVPMDVTSDVDVQRAVKFINADLGERKLQAVVNNAGVTAVTEVEWCPLETYRQVLEVNALGPIRVTQAFLPLLRKGNGSRVVVVASLAGRYTFPGFTAYSMSKSAAVSFADGLRREMKKWSITVHTIEPTLYKTPLTKPKIIQGTMQEHWDSSPDNVKKIYGEEYFAEFKKIISGLLTKAREPQQIAEVIDDMVDAVIGDEPKMRYVPSVAAQFRSQVITAMPMHMQDFVLGMTQPRTPPAAMLQDSMRLRRSDPLGMGKTLQRLKSVPHWFYKDRSIIFQFPEINAVEKKIKDEVKMAQEVEEQIISEVLPDEESEGKMTTIEPEIMEEDKNDLSLSI